MTSCGIQGIPSPPGVTATSGHEGSMGLHKADRAPGKKGSAAWQCAVVRERAFVAPLRSRARSVHWWRKETAKTVVLVAVGVPVAAAVNAAVAGVATATACAEALSTDRPSPAHACPPGWEISAACATQHLPPQLLPAQPPTVTVVPAAPGVAAQPGRAESGEGTDPGRAASGWLGKGAESSMLHRDRPVAVAGVAGAGVMTTREHMQAVRNAGDSSAVAGNDRTHPTFWGCQAPTCPRHGGARLREAQVGDGRVEKEALAPAVGHIAVALHWDVVVTAAVCMHIALAVMRIAVAVLLAAGVDGLGQLLYSSTGVSRGRIFNARSHIPTAGLGIANAGLGIANPGLGIANAGLGIANAGSRIRPGSELGGHWRWQRCVWLGGQRSRQSRALDEGGVVAVAPQQHVVWKGTLRPNARPQHPLHRAILPLLLATLLQQQMGKPGSLRPHGRPQSLLLPAPLAAQLKQLP
ncbi:unnamed protein product [Closterium sp. NIES-64]|nr:unnamed protein product [Closterium sp. NIES-64]